MKKQSAAPRGPAGGKGSSQAGTPSSNQQPLREGSAGSGGSGGRASASPLTSNPPPSPSPCSTMALGASPLLTHPMYSHLINQPRGGRTSTSQPSTSVGDLTTLAGVGAGGELWGDRATETPLRETPSVISRGPTRNEGEEEDAVELREIHLQPTTGQGSSVPAPPAGAPSSTAPPTAMSLRRVLVQAPVSELQQPAPGSTRQEGEIGDEDENTQAEDGASWDVPPPPNKPPLMRDVLRDARAGAHSPPSTLPPLAPHNSTSSQPTTPALGPAIPPAITTSLPSPRSLIVGAGGGGPGGYSTGYPHPGALGVTPLASSTMSRSMMSFPSQRHDPDPSLLEQPEVAPVDRGGLAHHFSRSYIRSTSSWGKAHIDVDAFSSPNSPTTLGTQVQAGEQGAAVGNAHTGGSSDEVLHTEDSVDSHDPDGTEVRLSGRLAFRLAVVAMGLAIYAAQCGNFWGYAAISAELIMPTTGYGPMLRRATYRSSPTAAQGTIHRGQPIYQNSLDGTVSSLPLPEAEFFYLGRPTPSTTTVNGAEWSTSLGSTILHSCSVLPESTGAQGGESTLSIWGLKTDLSTRTTEIVRIVKVFGDNAAVAADTTATATGAWISPPRSTEGSSLLAKALASGVATTETEEVLFRPFQGLVSLLSVSSFALESGGAVDSVSLCIEWQHKIGLLLCPLAAGTGKTCAFLLVETLPGVGTSNSSGNASSSSNPMVSLQCHVAVTHGTSSSSSSSTEEVQLLVSLHRHSASLAPSSEGSHYKVSGTSSGTYQSFALVPILPTAIAPVLMLTQETNFSIEGQYAFASSTQRISSSLLVLATHIVWAANASHFEIQVTPSLPLSSGSSSTSAAGSSSPPPSQDSYTFKGHRSTSPCGSLVRPQQQQGNHHLHLDVLHASSSTGGKSVDEVTFLFGEHAVRLVAPAGDGHPLLQCVPLWAKKKKKGRCSTIHCSSKRRMQSATVTMLASRDVPVYQRAATSNETTVSRVILLADGDGQGQLWRLQFVPSASTWRFDRSSFFMERIGATFGVAESLRPAAASQIPLTQTISGAATVLVPAAPLDVSFSCVSLNDTSAMPLCYLFDGVASAQVAVGLTNHTGTTATLQRFLRSRTKSATPVITRLALEYQWSLIGRAAETSTAADVNLEGKKRQLATSGKDALSFQVRTDSRDVEVYLS